MLETKEKTDKFIGFYNQGKEFENNNPKVIGKIPEWLNGSLIRTSSALFDFKNFKAQHWFDGLCLLYSFSFNNGKVSYKSKFLQSDDYINLVKKNDSNYQAFGTSYKRNILKKLKDVIAPNNLHKPNSNVNITKINNEFVVMTEIPNYLSFSKDSLDTIGLFNFQDDLKSQTTTAHPHLDFKTGDFYNISINFSSTSHYIFYKIQANSNKREIVAKIPVKSPCYLHGFSITEKYLILAECPLMVNPLDLMFSDKPFIQNYKWNQSQGSKFYIVDKETGNYKVIESNSFFSFHHINAYEENNNIILDLIAFDNNKIIDSFYLENLRNKEKIPQSRFRRFILDLDKKTCKYNDLFDISIELPRINYKRHNSKKYNYAYLNSQGKGSFFLNEITRVDLSKNELKTWQEKDCYAGEPVFVDNPQSHKENEGIVLSVVLDNKNKESFLLIIDTNNFEEIARVKIGEVIPLGFHGQFFK